LNEFATKPMKVLRFIKPKPKLFMIIWFPKSLQNLIRKFGFLILSSTYFLACWHVDGVDLFVIQQVFPSEAPKVSTTTMVVFLLSMVNVWNLLWQMKLNLIWLNPSI